MAPPRSRAAPSKRRAAPPNPSPDPDPTAVDEFNLHLLHAASEGDLRLLKRLVRALDKSRRDPREVLEAAKEDGVGALHIAARNGSVPVCRYLVEEIGVDVDIVGDESWILPVISSIVGPIQKKLATIGSPHFIMLLEGDCEMVELLLAKGVPVDPVSFGGTPLHVAAMGGHDEIVQILLENNADAGADVNDCLITPLAAGAEIKGLTACLELLLEAGADPNVPDPIRLLEAVAKSCQLLEHCNCC